jgi:hypothetical protein
MRITDRGLEIEPLDVIKRRITADFQSVFGADISLTPESSFSQIINGMALQQAYLQEGAETIYYSAFPSGASGITLDYVSSLNKVIRKGANASRIRRMAFRSEGASLVIPQGTIVARSDAPEVEYRTLATVTTTSTQRQERQRIEFTPKPVSGTWSFKVADGALVSGIPWDISAFALQTLLQVTNGYSRISVISGNNEMGYLVQFIVTPVQGGATLDLIQVDTSSLVSASGRPVGVNIIMDQIGGYPAIVEAVAVNEGLGQTANIGQVTELVTPLDGIVATFNLDAAVGGRDRESDTELNLRRTASIGRASKGTPQGLRAELLNIEGTQYARIVENTGNVPDVAGRPAKSFEAYVVGLDKSVLALTNTLEEVVRYRNQVAKVLLAHKVAGIEIHGSIPVTVTDSQGVEVEMKFSEPTKIPIYCNMTIQVNRRFPADGVATVRRIILEYGSRLGVGQNVIVYPDLIGRLRGIAGIVDIDTKIGTAPDPVSDQTIVINDGSTGNRIAQISDWKTEWITITTTANPV